MSFTSAFCLMCRCVGPVSATEAIVPRRMAFGIAACDEHAIIHGISADISDFEDAVHCLIANRADAECIITRDSGRFSRDSSVSLLTPIEFMAQLRIR